MSQQQPSKSYLSPGAIHPGELPQIEFIFLTFGFLSSSSAMSSSDVSMSDSSSPHSFFPAAVSRICLMSRSRAAACTCISLSSTQLARLRTYPLAHVNTPSLQVPCSGHGLQPFAKGRRSPSSQNGSRSNHIQTEIKPATRARSTETPAALLKNLLKKSFLL